MFSTSGQSKHLDEQNSSKSVCNGQSSTPPVSESINSEYARAIHDLNLLQSNTHAVALAKYKDPKQILPLFERQLNLAGINVQDLDRLNIIHVSGTKGKGSTCAFLESILRGEGLRTGFYNSPHLISVTERIRLDGQQIDEARFSKYFRYVYDRLQEATKRENISLPSYFSFLTILAYHIFLEEKIDCAIIEVGIGGQYDPTNIVRRPVACGITSIHFDHTNILGDAIESIARSKAGIAKYQVPVFTIEQEHKSALDVIRSEAKHRECPLFVCKPIDIHRREIILGIRGLVQCKNASLACQLGEYFLSSVRSKNQQTLDIIEQTVKTNLDELPPSFRKSLTACSWSGRCQVVEYPRISFYLDGAHTKESMENCLRWFQSEAGEESKLLMVNIIGDRDKYEILKPLARANLFKRVIFSTNRINSLGDNLKSETFDSKQTPTSDRSIENVITNAKIWSDLLRGQESSEVLIRSNIEESLDIVVDTIIQNPDKLYKVLITGSLHFVGAVLKTLPDFDMTLKQL